MDQIRLLFTANAGVLLRLPRFYAAVDAFHNKRTPPFSPVPVELMGQFSQDGTLSELQAVIVSHCHPDHCGKCVPLWRWHRTPCSWPRNNSWTDKFFSPDQLVISMQEMYLWTSTACVMMA